MNKKVADLYIATKLLQIEQMVEKKVVLIGKCPFCERRVRGSSHSQLEWNLSLHIRQRHKDNDDAEILLEQLEERQKILTD